MPFLEAELHGGAQNPETIFTASAEVDRGGFREIFRRAGDLPDVETSVDDLRQHLVVEDEIVGVVHEGHLLQHLSGEGAVAGVIL